MQVTHDKPLHFHGLRRSGALACRFFLAALLSFGAATHASGQTDGSDPAVGQALTVFDLPLLRARQAQVLAQLQTGNLLHGRDAINELIRDYPDQPENYYIRAAIRARVGEPDRALADLEAAVAKGFADSERLKAEQVFADLRDRPAFSALIEKAAATQAGVPAIAAPTARRVADGEALVDEANTGWVERANVLQSAFAFDAAALSSRPVTSRSGAVAETLNEWFRAGRAAGNVGDLYDNRDRGHAGLRHIERGYGQIAVIRYGPAAVAQNVDYSLNDRIFFNAPTVGNASLAASGSSLAKLALENSRTAGLLYLQYRNSHLYLYPAVGDHLWPEGVDEERKDRYSTIDRFPANTPYLIATRGRSSSEGSHLTAAVQILAAFRPEVKERLKATGALMPAVQMVLRRGMEGIGSREDYLSAAAHPTAFDGARVDHMKMIGLANALTLDNLPPVVTLKVVDESETILRDERGQRFDKGVLFDTPSAIARAVRSPGGAKTIIVSAEDTVIEGGREARFHWIVLEGDPDRIRIAPRNEAVSVVELTVPWHDRRPSRATPELLTDRVDIGVFVETGDVISAPAFISVYFPREDS